MKDSKVDLPMSGLYRPQFEKDSCGFGLITQMDGQASHWLVETAIQSLGRLTHRGAVSADGKTGDGCGLLMKMPLDYMRAKADEVDIRLAENFAVGVVFLSQDQTTAQQWREILNLQLAEQGFEVAGWRAVPTNKEACGAKALETLPRIEQVLVNIKASIKNAEQALFVARRKAEIELADTAFYIASLSSKTLSYKGLIMPHNLPIFYPDLAEQSLTSSLCVFHQRFSTNTHPQWYLAQPFRFLAHNGEINTVCGNRNWAAARAHILKSPLLPDLSELMPLVSMEGSDSCSLDNMLEVLMMGGMDLCSAMRLLIPPAWQNVGYIDPDLRAYFGYNSLHMEPWDGPAGIVLTDGRYAACSMDRNGLRPARYVITKDRYITLASEIGIYDYSDDDVATKGRLKPGEMIAVDTETGTLMLPEMINEQLKSKYPYRQWLKEHTHYVPSCLEEIPGVYEPLADKDLLSYQKMFDLSYEEKEQVIKVLANAGQEAVGSMGDDTPLPVLSAQVRSLYDNFRQQFAQVTNPPIDPLRERIVMGLETALGCEMNPFAELPEVDRLLLRSPIVSEYKFRTILQLEKFPHKIFDLNYADDNNLRAAIEQLCDEVVAAARDKDFLLVVLSDRKIARHRLNIHALLACGAVHHRLIKEGLRCQCNILIETATARDPHHFATLIGYGASAIFPYLSYQNLAAMYRKQEIDNAKPLVEVCSAYRQGINKGLLKIISKMGISTITSYRGAQLFEIVGLHNEVVNLCFKGTVSRLQGLRFADLEADQRTLAKRAWNHSELLQQGGLLKYIHDGEYHAYNPDVVQSLHKAVQEGDYDAYKVYADHVNHRRPTVFRDLLKLKSKTAIPLTEIEDEQQIVRRFDSAGMSLGALSPEAHETLAEAMNSLGGRSNSGEGGEDPARFGTNKSSKIKQVASGRFGVTPHYLSDAEVLQIKIAQGAKPGEGGQLPGSKVNKMIAKLRHSSKGIALISPPPHHDIYSIEDLAQLIFDLKQVNPRALVSVKLVAEAGVGTIAVGVAKAYADLITISGYDGGTGASPLTSIKYAGAPWELGLPETHLALRANNLRDKVRLQTDGGLKTGLDVVKAAILGAESFGFGTAPMIALGCKYLRICHLNNCATGVATQHKVLRLRHFIGKMEMVRNYFLFVARETREWMAHLGVSKFEELIGQLDLLEIIPDIKGRQKGLDLSAILDNNNIDERQAQFCIHPKNKPFDKGKLAERMVADMQKAIADKQGGEFHYPIYNVDRSIGARVSGEIVRLHGNYDMADKPLQVYFKGTAGQSFGAWNAGGLHLNLEGDANDYVGKGMAAGEIVVYPPPPIAAQAHNLPIIGNTCLYGATGGKFFAAGGAGERFAVRNSGVIAVVEGVGDHGCEYMTGGFVVVLGKTGLNFAAGMTGGLAMVFDQHAAFSDQYNHEMVDIYRINTEDMEPQREYLYSLLCEHCQKTGSLYGQSIVDDFYAYLPKFWMVKPKAAELDMLMASLSRAA
ncbi:MAG: glutamate synthase large subunit [Chromatiales bacterium]|nr:glutamate synthase large subunit [Chromatiales bacterium]